MKRTRHFVLAIALAISAYRRNQVRRYHELETQFADAIQVSIKRDNPAVALPQLEKAQGIYCEAQVEFPDTELTQKMSWQLNFTRKIILYETEFAPAHADAIMD